MKKYVDEYKDKIGRIDMTCPYCGGLHAVHPTSTSWGCRNCGNDFEVSTKVVILDKVKKWLGVKK